MNNKITREQLIALAQKAGERRLTPAERTRLIAGIEGRGASATFTDRRGRTVSLSAVCEGIAVSVGELTARVPFEDVTELCAVINARRSTRSFLYQANSDTKASLCVWARTVAGTGAVSFTVSLPDVDEDVMLFDDTALAAAAWLNEHDVR